MFACDMKVIIYIPTFPVPIISPTSIVQQARYKHYTTQSDISVVPSNIVLIKYDRMVDVYWEIDTLPVSVVFLIL